MNYSIQSRISGYVVSSCWASLEDIKNALNSYGITQNQKTYSDGMLNVRGSSVMGFYYGSHSLTGIAYLDAASGFENKTWTFYCTAVNSATMSGGSDYFTPSTLTYTEINVRASSVFPYISVPAIVDFKSCSPNDELEAVIPLTVGFVGYMGQNKRMELTVKSNDLPDSFDITLDNQSILNKQPQLIQMPSGQKEKQIETHLKGLCPDKAGEYVWNAEYITTIQ